MIDQTYLHKTIDELQKELDTLHIRATSIEKCIELLHGMLTPAQPKKHRKKRRTAAERITAGQRPKNQKQFKTEHKGVSQVEGTRGVRFESRYYDPMSKKVFDCGRFGSIEEAIQSREAKKKEIEANSECATKSRRKKERYWLCRDGNAFEVDINSTGFTA